MDVCFKTENGVFNYRVCGIILHDDKILALHDERSPYFYLPGGRVNLHEKSSAAILRELKEELLIDAKIIRALWVDENFFIEDVNRKKYHEICIYYLIDVSQTDLLNRGEEFVIHEGNKTLTFKWLDIYTLDKQYLNPPFIKKEILNLPDTLTLRVEELEAK